MEANVDQAYQKTDLVGFITDQTDGVRYHDQLRDYIHWTDRRLWRSRASQLQNVSRWTQ